MSITHCITGKLYSFYILESITELLESSGRLLFWKFKPECVTYAERLSMTVSYEDLLIHLSLLILSFRVQPHISTHSLRIGPEEMPGELGNHFQFHIFLLLLPLLSMSSTRHHRNEKKKLTFRNHTAAEVQILNLLLTSVLLNLIPLLPLNMG